MLEGINAVSQDRRHHQQEIPKISQGLEKELHRRLAIQEPSALFLKV
jgi:hypothetical protein